MAFRDDNEALRAQVEALRDEARGQEARHAEELAALEEKIAKLEGRKRPKPPAPTAATPSRWFLRSVFGAAALVVGLAAYLMAVDPERPARPEPPATPPGEAKVLARILGVPRDRLAEYAAKVIEDTEGWSSLGRSREARRLDAYKHAAVALAFARDGRRREALRHLDRGLALASRNEQDDPVVTLGGIACVAGELGDTRRQDAALGKARAILASTEHSDEELSARVQSAELCLELELAREIAPILAAAEGPAAKHEEVGLLVRLAALHAESKDVRGLNRTAELVLRRHAMTAAHGVAIRAELGVRLWRLDEKKRGLELVENAAVARGDGSVNLCGVVRALAIVGKTEQARKLLPEALERVRAEMKEVEVSLARAHLPTALARKLLPEALERSRAEMKEAEVSQARALLATAHAVLGDDKGGRALESDWSSALVDAGRLEEAIKFPSSYTWHPVAIHLRETGRYEQALERTGFKDEDQRPVFLAASYKIIQARKQRASPPAEARP